MKKKIAMMWVEALRGGEYTQAVGQLRTEDGGFCCLGVLCNLHAMEHPRLAAKETNPEQYLDQESYLPKQVMKWAGMKSNNGRFPEHMAPEGCHTADTLPELNDDEEMPFKEIGDFIEKNYKHL